MHYGTGSDTGIIEIEQDYEELWLNFVVYAGYSNDVGGNAEYLIIGGPNIHGGLSGLVIREEPEPTPYCHWHKKKKHHHCH